MLSSLSRAFFITSCFLGMARNFCWCSQIVLNVLELRKVCYNVRNHNSYDLEHQYRIHWELLTMLVWLLSFQLARSGRKIGSKLLNGLIEVLAYPSWLVLIPHGYVSTAYMWVEFKIITLPYGSWLLYGRYLYGFIGQTLHNLWCQI